MPSSQSELKTRIRALTGYDSDAISSDDVDDLIDIGQEEIQADVGDFDLEFFGDDTADQDNALFWLTGLFMKVRAGEIGAATFTLGELRNAPLDESSNFWMMRFERRLHNIADARGYGMASADRGATRDYSDYEL